MHHAVATYPNHLDSYTNPYLFGPTAYSPPAPARPLLSPKQPIGSITSQSNNNTSISAQSVLSSKFHNNFFLTMARRNNSIDLRLIEHKNKKFKNV